MKPAATGIGAAVNALANRPSPWSRVAKCNQSVYNAAIAKSAKKIVLTVIPPIFGIALLNGMPKLETYHQPLVDEKHSAIRNSTAVTTVIRLRDQRNTFGDTSTVASAAIAAPTAANRPKWCTHFVGVNIRKNIVPKMMPIRRHAGPRATPETRLRRSMMNMEANRLSAVIMKPKRRDSEPSTVGRNR